MKILIIFIYIVISIILFKQYISYSNEYYIDEPYITVYADMGLSNKLEVMLSYLSKAIKEEKKLRIIWIKNEHCPDDFKNLFEPIPNVEVIYVQQPSDYATFYRLNSDFESEKLVRFLKPQQHIQNSIDTMIRKLQENNLDYISCHIRRTDGINPTPDKEFINFINKFPTNLKIYIATDCRITQQQYISLYGDRMVYKKIEENNNFRQTSLQDAVVDMYVAAGAKYFKRSYGTYSNMIINLRRLNPIFTEDTLVE
jgi:hypothetical protein